MPPPCTTERPKSAPLLFLCKPAEPAAGARGMAARGRSAWLLLLALLLAVAQAGCVARQAGRRQALCRLAAALTRRRAGKTTMTCCRWPSRRTTRPSSARTASWPSSITRCGAPRGTRPRALRSLAAAAAVVAPAPPEGHGAWAPRCVAGCGGCASQGQDGARRAFSPLPPASPPAGQEPGRRGCHGTLRRDQQRCGSHRRSRPPQALHATRATRRLSPRAPAFLLQPMRCFPTLRSGASTTATARRASSSTPRAAAAAAAAPGTFSHSASPLAPLLRCFPR